ncbi:MAG: cytochrome b N-terminal domain-containing protein [bacterium]
MKINLPISKRIVNWFDERIPVKQVWKFLNKPVPKDLNFLFSLGSCALLLMILQIVTGVFLVIYYVPTPDHAYDSIKYIEHQVYFGKFIRGIHHWGASLLIIVMALHALRTFFWGSYKKPRELTWIFGVAILLVVACFAFTGALLPWDQKAYWETEVGTRIAGSAPYIGHYILLFIRGGETSGALTLSRFFSVHILFLPAALLIVLGFHLYLIRKLGISGSWNAREETPENSVPFFPDQVAKDIVAMIVVLIILIIMVNKFPVPMDRVADPTDLSYTPRPQWFFLFLYEMLKFFPGKAEFIGTMVIPGLAVVILFLVPFLDRKPERTPMKRLGIVLPSILVFAIIGLLQYRGYIYKPPKLAPEKIAALPPPTDIETKGEQLYQKLRCAECHKLLGTGGTIGPELSTVGRTRSGEWLITHFRNPQAVAPGFKMPVVEVNEEELNALAAYLLRQRGGTPIQTVAPVKKEPTVVAGNMQNLIAQGKRIYDKQNCSSCHAINKVGGTVGPELSGRGVSHNVDWHIKHFKNPAGLVSGSIMPPVDLPDSELQALADYIISLK